MHLRCIAYKKKNMKAKMRKGIRQYGIFVFLRLQIENKSIVTAAYSDLTEG